MNTVSIPNLDVKICTWKSQLTQGNFLHSLIQLETKIQIPFEPTDIDYDQIKEKISRMERVEYNNSVRRNVINVDDIE